MAAFSFRSRAARGLASLYATLVLAACGGQHSDTTVALLAAPPTASTRPSADAPAKTVSTLASIRHILIIVLENKGYDITFGSQSPAPYLSRDLPAQGALLTQYYGIGHDSLPNYIAMISGQAPSAQTQSDCQSYNDFAVVAQTSDGQAVGTGCVFPASVASLPAQFDAAGISWKAYQEDMGNDPAREAPACGHPPINAPDNTQQAQAPGSRAPAGDAYATRHNPFMYFHAVIDAPTCQQRVVGLDQLATDLADPATTAQYTFITPNLCHDGHDAPCASGEPGGLVSADAFLREWVPRITASPAYRKDGVLMIVFDEADAPGDATTCCAASAGPNAAVPGKNGPGGGRTGAVLLSPFIRPGTVSDQPYNHYAQLKTVETIFGLPFLGFANADGLQSFGTDVFAALP